MTTKEAKQWLWRARGIDREIDSLIKTRENEYARLTSITAQLSGMTVSGTKDPHKYDNLAELDDAIEKSIAALAKTKAEITNAIRCLDDQRHRQILKYYYVDCMTLEQIAVEMNYSFSHVNRIKYEAVKAIRDNLGKDDKQ